MKRFIRFENDRQVEVTTLPEKPSGEGWKTAPANFDPDKIYKLVSGKIEEVSEIELETERLNWQKNTAISELKRCVDHKRMKYVGESEAKRKCHEIQEKAANAVVDNPNSSLGFLIKPLADLRNISVLEMAELILEKAAQSNQKIIEAEAIEDEYQMMLENAVTSEALNTLMVELLTELEDF